MIELYVVTVYRTRIECALVDRLSRPHAKYEGDGMTIYYRVQRANGDVAGGWFGLGLNYVHYHAKNLGYGLRAVPIEKQLSSRKGKISDGQQKLI